MLEHLLLKALRFAHGLRAGWGERGFTAVEYGLMVALVTTLTIAAALLLDTHPRALLRTVTEQLGL
jgi:Flp pilus assembly pilin Flp